MKRNCLLVFIFTFASLANAKDLVTDEYRRNSLCQFFIKETKSNIEGIEQSLEKTFSEYKIPDKFNDHCMNYRTVSISDLSYTSKDAKYIGKRSRKSFGKALGSVLTGTGQMLAGNYNYQQEVFYTEKVPSMLYRYCLDNKIANKLIAKWFNASNEKVDGSFYNMSLIQERGAYNATELDKLFSQEFVRGKALLQDAGEELIPNTYVTFTMFSFESISKISEEAKKSDSKIKDGENPIAYFSKAIKEMRAMGTNVLGMSGFQVIAYTYLFKLKWTEEDMENFYNNYYNEYVGKLLYSNDFTIEYVGYHRNKGWFMTKTKDYSFNPNSDIPMVQQTAYRSMEKSFAELMKKYEDFRVKASIIDVEDECVTSFIGLKEGVNAKSQFEVLVKEYIPEKNKYRYKSVGKIKVDKKRIWNNLYSIEGVSSEIEEDNDANEEVDRTYLKGNTKNLAPGMLIRQIK